MVLNVTYIFGTVCLFTWNIFCILKWNFNGLRISSKLFNSFDSWRVYHKTLSMYVCLWCCCQAHLWFQPCLLNTNCICQLQKLRNSFRDMRKSKSRTQENKQNSVYTQYVHTYNWICARGTCKRGWERERDRESEIEGSVWGKWLLFSAVGKSQLQKLLEIPLNFAQITEGVQF